MHQIERKLLISRYALLVFIACNLIAVISFFVYKQVTLPKEVDDMGDARSWFLEQAYTAYAWSFLAMFLVLTTVVTVLIWRLKVKTSFLRRNISEYKSEITVLLITLVCFSVSYLARFVWDYWLHTLLQSNSFFLYNMMQLLFFMIFDFMPFCAIFCVHHQNFRH